MIPENLTDEQLHDFSVSQLLIEIDGIKRVLHTFETWSKNYNVWRKDAYNRLDQLEKELNKRKAEFNKRKKNA